MTNNYVRWAYLDFSVGLLDLSVGLSFCPFGSFYAPFLFWKMLVLFYS